MVLSVIAGWRRKRLIRPTVWDGFVGYCRMAARAPYPAYGLEGVVGLISAAPSGMMPDDAIGY